LSILDGGSARILTYVPVLAGAVLAAGSGTRMGRPKAEIVVAGTRLLDRAIGALRDGGCDPVFAVVRDGTAVSGAQPVINPDPDRGMRSSLELAVAAAADCDGLAVLLVDTPGIGAAAVRSVATHWRPGRIALARYPDGRRGHPTMMAPELWRAALAEAGPDEGARALLAAHPELVDAVDVPGDAADLDTPDDLSSWVAR
jgi:CTP:molybdopterin cytidylyltransferase MocA